MQKDSIGIISGIIVSVDTSLLKTESLVWSESEESFVGSESSDDDEVENDELLQLEPVCRQKVVKFVTKSRFKKFF